ncbi:MAG: RES family NAD+ phosphorylase [Massilia sp.]
MDSPGMRTWRIAIEESALDRSCEASRDSGGHWHKPGMAALYVATTAELGVLEKFVHTDGDDPSLVLVAIDLPDDPGLGRIVDIGELPEGWDQIPASGKAATFGTRFLEECKHLYMQVPSTIVHEGANLVINPAHPAYEQVRLQVVRPFSFDPRMFKR